MSKHKHNVANRDPEKVAKLRALIDENYDREIAELRRLHTESIETPYKVDPKDSRAGEKWLAEKRGRESVQLTRDNRIAQKYRLLEVMLDLSIDPKAVQEADQDSSATEHADLRSGVLELIAAARGAKNTEELKDIRSRTGDHFNIPTPPGSEPDEGGVVE